MRLRITSDGDATLLIKWSSNRRVSLHCPVEGRAPYESQLLSGNPLATLELHYGTAHKVMDPPAVWDMRDNFWYSSISCLSEVYNVCKRFKSIYFGRAFHCLVSNCFLSVTGLETHYACLILRVMLWHNRLDSPRLFQHKNEIPSSSLNTKHFTDLHLVELRFDSRPVFRIPWPKNVVIFLSISKAVAFIL
jgi:hypothetical protein